MVEEFVEVRRGLVLVLLEGSVGFAVEHLLLPWPPRDVFERLAGGLVDLRG
ncbi:hypothetical protein V9T20_12760 (plasmid) [Halobacterium salinarum]|uniref:hypothetical protein n=1 Tax=Halobacterium salinarum TaxID=2242 RepID=UPI0030CC73F4